MSEITLTFKGFRSIDEAKEFASWYSEQGEQDITIWLDARKDAGTLQCDWMGVKNIESTDNKVIVNLDIQ